MLHFTPNNPFILRSKPAITGRAYATGPPRHVLYTPLAAYAPLAMWPIFLSIHAGISCIARTAARAARVRDYALVNIRILAGDIHAAIILPIYTTLTRATRSAAILPPHRLAVLPTAHGTRALYRFIHAPAHPRGTNPTHESRPLSSANRPDSNPIPRDGRRTVRRPESPPFYNPRQLVKFYTRIYI